MATFQMLTPVQQNPMTALYQRIAALEQRLAILERNAGRIPIFPIHGGTYGAADLNNLAQLPAWQQSLDGTVVATWDIDQPVYANQAPVLWIKVNGRWRKQNVTP